jgi:exopolysaccharide production protein ExoQ
MGSAADQMLEGNPLDRAVFTGLLFAGLIVLMNRRKRVARILGQNLPILLFFGYCLISLTWSDFPGVAFKRWNKAIGDWVMILIVWTDLQPVAALKRLLAITTYTLIPLSILFIKYYPGLGRSYGRWLGEVHFVGVTTDKNTLGAICLLFGIASVWRVLNLYGDKHQNKTRNRQLIVQIAILAMILWLFSILDAMTSLSCFLMATCLIFAIRLRVFAKRRFLVHCLVLVTVLIPVSVTLLGVSPEALKEMGRNPTLTERTDIWAEVIKLVPNRWVGAGYESFWLGPRLDTMIATVTRWWVPNESHNGYLEIYANLGWLGVGALAVVIFWGYARVFRNWRQNLPASNLMLAYFVSGVIFNLTEAAFFRMMTPVWLFFLLAISEPKDAPRQSKIEVFQPHSVSSAGLPLEQFELSELRQ